MLSRIRITFTKDILFNNTRDIIKRLTQGTERGASITLPVRNDGFFDRELALVVASLSDTLRQLLYNESDPSITSDNVVVDVSLYAKRQKIMLPSALEIYICQSIAYSWLIQNGFGYGIIDIVKYHDDLRHIVLMKDAPVSRKPGF